MFEQELRSHIGEQVQVAAATDVVIGLLVSVTDAAVTVRAAQYPGYGGEEDVSVRMDSISYVRIML
ncbi:hypothetical protein [Cohnella caldifontis]|uniref:hypothetical protein n=1 Tax=Cohnella caldifontis TaxID=3027471 RepID=UPI0023EC2A90|nr:hypothetical protein [Cohnella sp. YIM B05605]